MQPSKLWPEALVGDIRPESILRTQSTHRLSPTDRNKKLNKGWVSTRGTHTPDTLYTGPQNIFILNRTILRGYNPCKPTAKCLWAGVLCEVGGVWGLGRMNAASTGWLAAARRHRQQRGAGREVPPQPATRQPPVQHDPKHYTKHYQLKANIIKNHYMK